MEKNSIEEFIRNLDCEYHKDLERDDWNINFTKELDTFRVGS